jgi:hypothetical protein
MARHLIALAVFYVSAAFSQTQLDNILSIGRLPYLKQSRLIQISSNDTTGGNADFITIKDGATGILAEMPGPGVVTRFWVTISSSDPYFLRRILLRMYWDGEKDPSVEVPIGDFFGTGFMYRQYVTGLVGMSSGGYYSYIPMPFNKRARIEVVNQTGAEVGSFYYQIDYQKLSVPLDSTVAYFHAHWRRELKTNPKHNYTILEARGHGHFIGVNMSMQSYGGDLSYLEGDEMIYVDGETRPSIAGTGTEDYFTSGWYFNHGEFAAPYHGLILKDDSLGRIAAYRFQILDAVPFTRSLRVTIEHGHANEEIADYSSTAYWYQKEPHQAFEAMLPPSLRIPLRVAVPNGALEAESLQTRLTGIRSTSEDMSPYGPDWSGLAQLAVLADSAGRRCSLLVPAAEDRYTIGLFYTKGPSYGDVEVRSEGKPVGRWSGFSKTVSPGGKISLTNIRLKNGREPLEFIVSGKDPRSSGYSFGIDAFVLEPYRKYIPQWYMIGPFPNERDSSLRRLGLDRVYGPEREFDISKTYPGVDNKPVGWTLDETPANGRMDLYKYEPNELVVVYALTFLYSPNEQTLPLLLGTDDGVKVFLNDKEVHRVLTVRIAVPDQDTVKLPLFRGWNKLLLKIENNFGGYNFYARVLDPEESLMFSPKKEK